MAFATSPRLFIAIPHPSFLLRAAEWSQASSLRAGSATDAPNGSRSAALSAKRSLNVLLCPLWVKSGEDHQRGFAAHVRFEEPSGAPGTSSRRQLVSQLSLGLR